MKNAFIAVVLLIASAASAQTPSSATKNEVDQLFSLRFGSQTASSHAMAPGTTPRRPAITCNASTTTFSRRAWSLPLNRSLNLPPQKAACPESHIRYAAAMPNQFPANPGSPTSSKRFVVLVGANNSFKPSPLRGLGRSRVASRGPA